MLCELDLRAPRFQQVAQNVFPNASVAAPRLQPGARHVCNGIFANQKLSSEGAERVFECDLVNSIASPEAWHFQKQVSPPRNAEHASNATLPIAELRRGARDLFSDASLEVSRLRRRITGAGRCYHLDLSVPICKLGHVAFEEGLLRRTLSWVLLYSFAINSFELCTGVVAYVLSGVYDLDFAFVLLGLFRADSVRTWSTTTIDS